MRPKRFELVVTHAGTGRAWASLHDTMSEALLVAEKFRAAPGAEQVFGVVIRDKRQPTGDAEVANLLVVLELT
jgi:hypothetical protein